MRILLPGQYDAVANVVCGYFDVKPGELKSRLRTQRVSTARRVIWYLLKTVCDTCLSEISRHTGNVPSAISLGVIRVCDLISVDREFAQTISLLESRCRILFEVKE